MAELLHRLGLFAARRAKTVLTAWAVILGIAVGGFLVGFATLTSSFDVPGTASGEVIEELEQQLPEFSGAAGTVVYATEDGSALSESQRAEISALVASADGLTDVAGVVDPFDTEATRAEQAAELAAGRHELADGRTQLDAGRAQLDSGQQQLDAGRAQLDSGQQQLDAGRAQAEAAGFPTAELDAQQAQLDAQRAELDRQQERLTGGLAELETQAETLAAGQAKLELGGELLAMSDGIRMVSEDGSTAIVNVAFTEPRLDLSQDAKDGVIEHFESAPIAGLQLGFSADIAQGIPQILGIGEVIGVLVAAVVLIIVLGSWLAATFPLITAIVGVGIGSLATLAFSGVVQMASVTPIFGVMLGLAVGIDYALFIINRHRKQLLEGMPVRDSIALANGTAGTAVVFAGATVIVALLALNITGIPFLGLMGTAGALSILIAVLLAISAIPALLGLAGDRVLGRTGRAIVAQLPGRDGGAPPASVTAEPARGGAAKPIRAMPTWRAVVTAVGVVAALLVIAIPSLSMRMGLPGGESEPAGSPSHLAHTLTEEQFGAGATGTILVTAALPAGLDEDAVLESQVEVARVLSDTDDVVAVAPIAVSEDQRLAAFQVIPAEGPNSESTERLVRDLRALPPVGGEIALGVAGQAAINIDISEGLAEALPVYLLVVVGLSFLIMLMVFRSLLVPLVATAGFVLSLFATFGVATAVFQWGWFGDLLGIHTPGPLLSFLPIILVGILFGLAMDYQLFLSTGMREAFVHGSPARLAVAEGFRAGRRVVIAAALIMIAVFGGFISSDSVMIKSFGVGLAVGVLLDAFLVRMLLMPAVMHLLGASAWWLPRWLDRILPNVDVEGARIERKHPAPAA
ncbi:MMPL family transporter [Leucobacter sp. M11]|uniref:MMPL family transporter n=1 Tax=Leucobacter sp. M11 TaxID=2993565 RepID=UPI002D8005EC|nr:MMPL family transporter [Leucobacter sp. M11]MEB4616429.1 MMPL family transporter [Leucobacter sp. M11]